MPRNRCCRSVTEARTLSKRRGGCHEQCPACSDPTADTTKPVFCWTSNVRSERILDVTTKISARHEERYRYGRSATAGRLSSNGRYRPSRAIRLSQFMLLAITAYFCSSLALWAQTSDSQTDEANK